MNAPMVRRVVRKHVRSPRLVNLGPAAEAVLKAVALGGGIDEAVKACGGQLGADFGIQQLISEGYASAFEDAYTGDNVSIVILAPGRRYCVSKFGIFLEAPKEKPRPQPRPEPKHEVMPVIAQMQIPDGTRWSRALGAIREHGPISAGDVTLSIGAGQGDTFRAVTTLFKRGYVEKHSYRPAVYTITPLGMLALSTKIKQTKAKVDAQLAKAERAAKRNARGAL